jgi:hypothetical protein
MKNSIDNWYHRSAFDEPAHTLTCDVGQQQKGATLPSVRVARSVGRGMRRDPDIPVGVLFGQVTDPAVSASRERGAAEVRAGYRRALETPYGETTTRGPGTAGSVGQGEELKAWRDR